MTDQPAEPAAQTRSRAAARDPEIKVTVPDPDWSQPQLSPDGYQLASDGLPSAQLARAMALAANGEKKDPLGIVTPDQIAAHDPVAAQLDREAVDKFHADQAAKEAAEREAAAKAEADQPPASL